MRKGLKLIAVLTAGAVLLGLSGLAQADDRDRHRGMSTTEKVITGIAIAAAAGLTAYALSKGRLHDFSIGYHQHSPRRYMALDVGFHSYSVGGPNGLRYRYPPRGYWFNSNGIRFWRVPYVYNPRYDHAFNAGWERGYWAGYLEGLRDARIRARYYDQFYGNGGPMWGYSSAFGSHDNYQRAFMLAFSIGYRHGFNGYPYGANEFGFQLHVNYRR